MKKIIPLSIGVILIAATSYYFIFHKGAPTDEHTPSISAAAGLDRPLPAAASKNQKIPNTKLPAPEPSLDDLVMPGESLSSESEYEHLPISEADKKLLKTWEKARGYDILDKFIPHAFVEQLQASGYDEAHPYSKLSLDLLQGEAINGDVTAQLYYGLNLLHNIESDEEKLAEGVEWLKEAVINTGYSGPINHISSGYSNRLLTHEMVNPHDSNNEFSSKRQQYYQNESIKWALVGRLSNDFHAEFLLKHSEFDALSPSEQQRLQADARVIYSEINTARTDRGNAPIYSEPLPSRISNIYLDEDDEIPVVD